MMNTEPLVDGTRFSGTDLYELQRQLSAWRQEQSGRARVPEEVWLAASKLAEKLGTSCVARTLRLDYYKLRRRCDRTCSRPRKVRADAASGFVELKLKDSLCASFPGFRVQLSDRRGTQMSFELAHDVPALVALTEAFLKQIP